QIEVTFDINADGILHVNAKDKATGREQMMQIIPSSGLSDNEIENMVKDAEQHASEDLKRKEAVEVHNTADSAVYSAEKFLKDNAESIPDAQKTAVQTQIDAVKSALSGGDASAIQAAAEQLQAVMQEAGAAMYQQQGQAPGGDPSGDSSTDGDEDVIEGEFSDM
ncbi:MAG: Hsp70 family protein, partial [Anaerolineales bacterium]|nr:Hsp70 family protein [Anaerolineales bacterium]